MTNVGIPRSSFHGKRNFNIISGLDCAGTGFRVFAGRVCAGKRLRLFTGPRDTGYENPHFSRNAGYGIRNLHFARDHGIRDTAFRSCLGPRDNPEFRTIPGKALKIG